MSNFSSAANSASKGSSLTAKQLAPRLEFLYKSGMTSFLHAITAQHMRKENKVSQNEKDDEVNDTMEMPFEALPELKLKLIN